MAVTCPNCKSEFTVAAADQETALCPECGTELRLGPAGAGGQPADQAPSPPPPPPPTAPTPPPADQQAPPPPATPPAAAEETQDATSVAGGSAQQGRDRYVKLKAGDVLGGFRLDEMIGAGAMAVVYEATQLSLNLLVALKILPDRFADIPTFVERFDKETDALAALNHPNIVTIIERGHEGRSYYFAMEYIEGRPLRQKLGEDLPPIQLVKIIRQVCAALEYAHSYGVVHRDIKPANIMINNIGDVKIADFGLAGLMSEGEEVREGRGRAPTRMGTAGYMAPEQIADPLNVDGRADIYSLGVVLYMVLADQMPPTPYVPPSTIREAADPRLDPIVEKCLEPNREKRYASGGELLQDIRAYEKELGLAPKCPNCGTVSPVRFKNCQSCQQSLEEQFDVCPKCGADNREDVSSCLNCHANLQQSRKAVRGTITKLMAQVHVHEDRREFDEALAILEKICSVNGEAFQDARNRAEGEIRRMRNRRSEFAIRNFKEGKALFDRNKVQEALALWHKVPNDVIDLTDTIQRAENWMNELASIDTVRRAGVLAAKPSISAELPAQMRKAFLKKVLIALAVLVCIGVPIGSYYFQKANREKEAAKLWRQTEREKAVQMLKEMKPPKFVFEDYVLPIQGGWKTLSQQGKVKWGAVTEHAGYLGNDRAAPRALYAYDGLEAATYQVTAEGIAYSDPSLTSGTMALYARYWDTDSYIKLELRADQNGGFAPSLEVRRGASVATAVAFAEPDVPKSTGSYQLTIRICDNCVIALVDGTPVARAEISDKTLPPKGRVVLEANNMTTMWRNFVVSFEPEFNSIDESDVVRSPTGGIELDDKARFRKKPGGMSIGGELAGDFSMMAVMQIIEQSGESADLWIRRFVTDEDYVQLHIKRNEAGECEGLLEISYNDPETWEVKLWQGPPQKLELLKDRRYAIQFQMKGVDIECAVAGKTFEAEYPGERSVFDSTLRIESKGLRTKWTRMRIRSSPPSKPKSD